MLRRIIEKHLQELLARYPAVALLGPRQVGKTTLAKQLSKTYFDLEIESERLRLDLQLDDILQSQNLIILDEAQNYPDILPKLRHAIDAKREQNGRFLILGSVSPALMTNVSEFLTGRIALAELCPFSILELNVNRQDDLWLMGGFPNGGVLNAKQYPEWQKFYLDLLATRDLPVWGLPAQATVTSRLFRMIAAIHGTVVNASQLGKSMGVSYHTINSYLRYLEQAYLTRRIGPYFINIKKRLVKAPKIYWRDSGILHSLLNIQTQDDLLAQPWVGHSWEGWIIEQIVNSLSNAGSLYDGPYFFRTHDGHEIDLVINLKGKIWAFEIKLTSQPSKNDMDRLNANADLINADYRVLLSRTKHPLHNDRSFSMNLPAILDILLHDSK
ncbi:ATP-binding protein [candidate division KSB1 bacterium]|nr:ATP-binding protein [candidate division KSB1 bacterium]RQW06652.1 MAG: ATP-binding protein [candidate division KSB1 bacterium]